jgi:hypothetical protein
MGKAEVREDLYVFLERGAEHAFEEMRPLAVVGLGSFPGNRAAKLLLRPLILGGMNEIEMSVKNTLTLAMDYSEEIARDENADGTRYKRKSLESDIFYNNYEGDRKEDLRDTLKHRFDEMARDMAPLVNSGADGFWEAAVEAYDKHETEELLRHHFSFVSRVVEEFGDEMVMTSTIGPFEFNYTDEAMRVLPLVETRLRRELVDEADEVYGRRYGGTPERDAKSIDVGGGHSGDGETKKGERGREAASTETPTPSADSDTSKEIEKLRERVDELEKEKKRLRRKLEEERESNEELRRKLEKERKETESESYSAEDWLG